MLLLLGNFLSDEFCADDGRIGCMTSLPPSRSAIDIGLSPPSPPLSLLDFQFLAESSNIDNLSAIDERLAGVGRGSRFSRILTCGGIDGGGGSMICRLGGDASLDKFSDDLPLPAQLPPLIKLLLMLTFGVDFITSSDIRSEERLATYSDVRSARFNQSTSPFRCKAASRSAIELLFGIDGLWFMLLLSLSLLVDVVEDEVENDFAADSKVARCLSLNDSKLLPERFG